MKRKSKQPCIDLSHGADFNKARREWAKQLSPAQLQAAWEKTSRRMARYSRVEKSATVAALPAEAKRRNAS